jgi:hypothetical protein
LDSTQFESAPDKSIAITRDHLIWMCDQIIDSDWPTSKMHRWVGFIQGILIAKGLSTIDEERTLVSETKLMFREEHDYELWDHHNPDCPFELDIGGES